PLHEGLGIPSVDSITVNSIQDNPARNQHFLEKYGADIETMEGAALHYVCLQENIPFVQLRGISNRVGERDKLQWKLNEAIENLHQQTDKFLQNILKDYQ